MSAAGHGIDHLPVAGAAGRLTDQGPGGVDEVREVIEVLQIATGWPEMDPDWMSDPRAVAGVACGICSEGCPKLTSNPNANLGALVDVDLAITAGSVCPHSSASLFPHLPGQSGNAGSRHTWRAEVHDGERVYRPPTD